MAVTFQRNVGMLLLAAMRVRRALVRGWTASLSGVRVYDTLPDGKRFIAAVDASQLDSGLSVSAPQINVVLNWFEELKRLVPAN